MRKATILVFEILEKAWSLRDCALIDMKIEFGVDTEGACFVSRCWRLLFGYKKNIIGSWLTGVYLHLQVTSYWLMSSTLIHGDCGRLATRDLWLTSRYTLY